MVSMFKVLKEQYDNFHLITRLAAYELKSANYNNYLGSLWELLNPAIQISIYWFLFGFVQERDQVQIPGGGKYDFFPWMLAGITIWFFIYPSITHGSKSIYSRLRMVSRMNFPLSVIPSYVILSKLLPQLMLMLVTIILFQFMGIPISIYYLQIPYFLVATILFLFALSLVTSTISTIVRDFQMLIQSLMRVLLFITPILWPLRNFGETFNFIMKLNPFYYLIEGFRYSLLGEGWFLVEHAGLTFYFWVVLIILLLLGSYLHVRFRKHFIDFL
ncbi:MULTISPECIES: ABC transporter permease [unclassified Niallia]|uniref:ABC transporter permease n=1 Tax=unclassified Niallia TaxID=2837522 RepID=UPI002041C555|nr:ABC transporter permease [Niallia sp. MER 6]MCM3029702.1 ABC transporter permease [Niallia sp. MER 6]